MKIKPEVRKIYRDLYRQGVRLLGAKPEKNSEKLFVEMMIGALFGQKPNYDKTVQPPHPRSKRKSSLKKSSSPTMTRRIRKTKSSHGG